MNPPQIILDAVNSHAWRRTTFTLDVPRRLVLTGTIFPPDAVTTLLPKADRDYYSAVVTSNKWESWLLTVAGDSEFNDIVNGMKALLTASTPVRMEGDDLYIPFLQSPDVDEACAKVLTFGIQTGLSKADIEHVFTNTMLAISVARVVARCGTDEPPKSLEECLELFTLLVARGAATSYTAHSARLSKDYPFGWEEIYYG